MVTPYTEKEEIKRNRKLKEKKEKGKKITQTCYYISLGPVVQHNYKISNRKNAMKRYLYV